MTDHTNFLEGIHRKKVLKLKFNAREKGVIERTCVPFDFGPSNVYPPPNPDRYHFYDLDSPDGPHNLSILVEQVISIELTDQTFNPEDYIKWSPKWIVPRDWGAYS